MRLGKAPTVFESFSLSVEETRIAYSGSIFAVSRLRRTMFADVRHDATDAMYFVWPLSRKETDLT